MAARGLSPLHVYDLKGSKAGSRVLDLGYGGGFLLLVCKHVGYEAVGLDLDDDPVFNSLVALFGLRRVTCAIHSEQKLPDLGGPFDTITAFMTCFNKLADGAPWGAEPWRFLLEDGAAIWPKHLAEGGRIALKYRSTGEYYPREVGTMIRALPFYSTSFYRDSVVLRAR